MTNFLFALIILLVPAKIALIDGFWDWHADQMMRVLEVENTPYTYYQLDWEGENSWQQILERELARARNNHEKTVVVESCFLEYHSGLVNQLKMLSESGAEIFIPACYAGQTIHSSYLSYVTVVSALDDNGNRLPNLNNGPEVNQYIWACWLENTCSTSEAAVRAAIR